MNKLALNFIFKNEEHVIERMLNSTKLNGKSIEDLIVAINTGPKEEGDKTTELMHKWGKENNVPVYVFHRPFDNFQDSRNYGMMKLKDVVKELGWNLDEVWGHFYDADEQLVIDQKFDKNQFNKDLYMINTYIGAMKYTRNTFFRVSKCGFVEEDEIKFKEGKLQTDDCKPVGLNWHGPVHEFITSRFPHLTSGLAENITVSVQMDGASWKSGNIADKYKKHSAILEDYIDNKNRDPRWVFYLSQSYHDSATLDNRVENEERLRRALKYYRERVSMIGGYEEERYYSQLRIGAIMRAIEEPWSKTLVELQKAYAMDPLRGESIKIIIDYYLSMNEWHLAYLYSKFAKVNFHNKNPYPTRLLFVDESLYVWKFLEVHSASSFYCGKKDEARSNFLEIQEVIKKYPQYFSQEDIAKINSNAQFFK